MECKKYSNVYLAIEIIKTDEVFKLIPSVTDSQINSLLEETSGYLSDGTKMYRPYVAIATLLLTKPDLWLIKKHDATEVNSPYNLINALQARQKSIDEGCGIKPGAWNGNSTTGTKSRIVSYLPRVVG